MSLRGSLALLALPSLIAIAACARPDAGSQPAAAAPPAAPAFDLARTDKARLAGSESAKVWFIMGSDFECPYCKAFHDETWPRIEQEYVKTGKLRVAFMNFPMNLKAPPMHPRSVPSAEVAMCAGAQDKFWQMHDSLFASQDRWARVPNPTPVWESLAQSLGLDMTAWRNCLSSHATRTQVEQDFSRMAQVGVTGTPSFVIGDSLAVVGAAPFEEFRKAIDAALARKR
jgi:protein-disulfide isomerase